MPVVVIFVVVAVALVARRRDRHVSDILTIALVGFVNALRAPERVASFACFGRALFATFFTVCVCLYCMQWRVIMGCYCWLRLLRRAHTPRTLNLKRMLQHKRCKNRLRIYLMLSRQPLPSLTLLLAG